MISFEHAALSDVKGEVPEEEYTIPFGQAVVRRKGTDVTVIALAQMAHLALAVAEEMEREGVFREAIRASVVKTGRLVVVDEACQTCGAAAEILSLVVEDVSTFTHLKSHPKRVCGLDVPFPFSPPMEQYAISDKEKIVAAVREVTGAMSTWGRDAVK